MVGKLMKIYRPKLCECGCKQETKYGKENKSWNRFIYGHNGKRSVPGVSEKNSKAMKEKWQNPEFRKRMCRSQIVAQNRPETVKIKSKVQTKAMLKKWQDPEFRKRMIEIQNSLKTKQKRKATNNLPEVKEKHRKTMIKLWQDPEFAKKMGEAWSILPNKQEVILMKILDQLYPGEWKFTGNFSFLIGGKNPDFVNINGQKKCIEYYGTYWHKGDDPQDRIDLFKSCDWDCLVIWDRELKNFKNLRRKIFDFTEK